MYMFTSNEHACMNMIITSSFFKCTIEHQHGLLVLTRCGSNLLENIFKIMIQQSTCMHFNINLPLHWIGSVHGLLTRYKHRKE